MVVVVAAGCGAGRSFGWRGEGHARFGEHKSCTAACLRILVRDGWADGWHSVEQPEAWSFGHAVLQSETIGVEAKLFAASTLKGKVRLRSRKAKLGLASRFQTGDPHC